MLLELLEDFAFLLSLLPRTFALFPRLAGEDLRLMLGLRLLTAGTLCCLPLDTLGRNLAAVPKGAAAAVLAVAAFSSDGGPGGIVKAGDG